MATTLIGLMGKKRAGKDTFAERLVSHHDYTRVAFADLVREAALALDPIVGHVWEGSTGEVRLSALVSRLGWDRAKEIPEVRRTLQRLGSESIRSLDPDFWVRAGMARVDAIDGPVVITDVRFPNEHDAVSTRLGTLVRISRPGQADVGDQHASEVALDTWEADVEVVNDKGIFELQDAADAIATFAEEQRRTVADLRERVERGAPAVLFPERLVRLSDVYPSSRLRD